MKTARGLVVAAALCAAALCLAATLVHYPYLQNVRTDRATILWATLGRDTGSIRYSSDGTFSRTVPASVREFLIVYANGLGPVTGSIVAGPASPPDPPARTSQAPAVL